MMTRAHARTLTAASIFVAVATYGARADSPTSGARADGPACDALRGQWDATRAQLAPPQISTTLLAAADRGCVGLMRAVLTAGGSVDARDRFGNRALARAARAGQTEAVALLLGAGAAVNARNAAGSTALSLAAERGQSKAARLLLDHGADPNLAGRSGVAPLAAAAFTGNAPLADVLLAHGADPRAADATGKTAIVYAAAQGARQIVTTLLTRGIDVNARYAHDLTVLMWAAGYADGAPQAAATALVADLLARGARVDDADDRGRTALMVAAERGHADVVRLLLAHGADPGRQDRDGKRAADLTENADVRTLLKSS